jgi:Xaa-Pro aminopeptidase
VITARDVHVLGVERECVPANVDRHDLVPGKEAAAIAERLAGARRLGIDRLTLASGQALARLLPRTTFTAADKTVLAARRVKTSTELALLREAQQLNEAAIAEVLPAIVPGVREVELTGRFLAAMAARGVTTCHVEPLWCVLPRSAADAPWTFAGGLPYRELPDTRRLAPGDQVMIDTGMLHAGYMSDFGCTWPCGGELSEADRRLRARWEKIVAAVLAVCRPGSTGTDLHAAALAANGRKRPPPWPVPLYLAHGLGIGGVEPPFIGADLGLAAEEQMVLVPGMVLVLEPYVWEKGLGGYRAEQTIAITEDGHVPLSAPPP